MDFMNLHQAAHGDREFGYIETRLRVAAQDGRRPLEGPVRRRPHRRLVARGLRVARGPPPQGRPLRRQHAPGRRHRGRQGRGPDPARRDGQRLRLGRARRGGPRRPRGGRRPPRRGLRATSTTWRPSSAPTATVRSSLRDAARIEAGLRAILTAGGFGAWTDTFEDLDGLSQLPGIAAQRLMADGFGFGAEGDWKSAVMVRLLKVMATGLPGGTSFMEDYTYDLDPANPTVLGAHMLEVCPSHRRSTARAARSTRWASAARPTRCGWSSTPPRARRSSPGSPTSATGSASSPTSIDIVAPGHELPRLPVARAVWKPRPDMRTAVEAWLSAGGAHHTALSRAIGPGAADRLRRDGRHRAAAHRRDDDRGGLPARGPLEPGVPPPRARVLGRRRDASVAGRPPRGGLAGEPRARPGRPRDALVRQRERDRPRRRHHRDQAERRPLRGPAARRPWWPWRSTTGGWSTDASGPRRTRRRTSRSTGRSRTSAAWCTRTRPPRPPGPRPVARSRRSGRPTPTTSTARCRSRPRSATRRSTAPTRPRRAP